MKKLLLGVFLTTTMTGFISTDTNNSEYPILSVLKKMHASSHQDSYYGVDNGDEIEDIWTFIPKGTTQFNNKSLLAVDFVYVRNKNNKFYADGEVTHYHSRPFRYEGHKTSDGNTGVVEESSEIPETAKVGDSGLWYKENVYEDSTKTTIYRTVTATWRLEEVTKSTADFCINYDSDVLNPSYNTLHIECHTINKKGDILKTSLWYFTKGLLRLELSSR